MSRRGGFESWGAPALSLAIAVLLWYYVVGQKEREWMFAVPVQVHVSSSEVAGWSTPEKISVLLQGPQRLLDRLQSDSLAVRLVLAETQSGQYTRGVLPSMIAGVPPGVRIVRLEPAEVRVDIRPLLELRYRVVPQVRSSADGRFAIMGPVETDPKYVELRGTGNVLQDVTEVRTEIIEASGPPGPRRSIVSLIAPPGTRVLPQAVTVSYIVTEAASGPDHEREGAREARNNR